MTMLTKITPIAKNLTVGRKKLAIGKLGFADFKITSKKLDGTLAKNALAELYRGLSLAVGAPAESADGAVSIKLEISSRIPESVEKNADQAYKIVVNKNGVTLTGYGEAGAYYAVTTLLQTVSVEDNVVYIPEMKMVDYPDLRTRGHFLETRYGSNLMTLEDWKEVVDNMASMKHNQLVVSLYGCWQIQYDGVITEYVYIPIPKYPLIKSDVIKKYYSPKKGGWVNEVVEVPMVKEDFFGELIAYGKSKGVEVLPLWNSYGHNTLIPRMYPEVAPIVNGEPQKIGFCVSSPKTYELLFDIYDLIIDKYLNPNGIKSFHIGLDEVWDARGVDVENPSKLYSPWCQCPECAKMTNQEKTISHAIKLITHLKERGMKNVYIYNDLLTRMFKDPHIFYEKLKENDLLDVTVVDWWAYTDIEKKFIEQAAATTTYPELGIRSTVKPWNSYYHWNLSRDSVNNIYLHTTVANRDKNAEGLMSYAAWDKTCDINHVAMADFAWSYALTGSTDDFRENYAYRLFPNNAKLAKRAIMLYKELTSMGTEGNALPIPETTEISNANFVREILSYYGYSYYNWQKDYPRNFPGEGMQKLYEHRAVLEPKLHELSKLADETYKAFEKLRLDLSGNFEMARRYSAEARNWRDIVDDYIALLEIGDIVKSKDKDANKKVAKIAGARRKCRLELLAEMEDFKEEYLHASHLRNQSIYMQIFADIEAYARKTPAEEFTLDLCDLRPIASDMMNTLR